MRLLALCLCLTLFPVHTYAQDSVAVAERKYNHTQSEYVRFRDWTISTFKTGLSYAENGDDLSACANFKGARDAAAEQIDILTDLIAYGQAANKDVSEDRKNLALTQETHKDLIEFVDIKCGPGTRGDPHTI